MYDDMVKFRVFYQTSFGQAISSIIQKQLGSFWRGGPSLSAACLGYGFPQIDAIANVLALMPTRHGAIVWPTISSVRGCLVEPYILPLPDVHLDRLLLMHALEFDPDPGKILEECWRVLDGAGRLMVVVPNRRGLLACAEHTPFGHGRSFSSSQLQQLLRAHGFEPRQTYRAVFFPLLAGKFFQRFSSLIERIGTRLWPATGCVLLVEAEKILYAASNKGSKLHRRKKKAGTSILVGQARGTFPFKILT